MQTHLMVKLIDHMQKLTQEFLSMLMTGVIEFRKEKALENAQL